MVREQVREQLTILIERYNTTLRLQEHSNISEETVRTWLNEFLGVFGWNVQDPNQILQERILRGTQQERLDVINSPHRRPDYILKNGTNIKTFLDAKSLDVNIFSDREAAYQIRSYGWSAQSPCAFVSNFEQFVIYDTRLLPSPEQPAIIGTIQLSVDNYIENFDVLYEHLWHDLVCSNHLETIYETTEIEGRNRLDERFAQMLSEFRLRIANDLLEHNPELLSDNIAINYYVQVILDRIIFIRVCESKEIEEQEKLKSFSASADGFWNSFKRSCYMEFYNHYDGAMFERDENFQQLLLSNAVMEQFIEKLYYPYPYKFDVIPVKVIANIYEEFLGKQLVITGQHVLEVTKEEYVRTNGAVCTPEHIVDMICKQTINLEHVDTIESLLNVKILDPCCGSGVFLVSCYEILVNRMRQILVSSEEERRRYSQYIYAFDNTEIVTIEGRRAITVNCLHGVDCDESAIEVAKMSLALKIVDGTNPLAWEGIGAFRNMILREISKNIKLGNTLVDTDANFNAVQTQSIKPLDIRNEYRSIFDAFNGFHFIVGNPPYVETKHYKAAQPAMHAYLSIKYQAFEGKADLAVLFIEKCLSLLNIGGKLGFIIQRRWFKTNYGNTARLLINSGKCLCKLIDFKSTDIFRGRITYVSIMILGKNPCENVLYYNMLDSPEEIKSIFENSNENGEFDGCIYSVIPSQSGTAIWAYESYAIAQIKERLSACWGTLKDYPQLAVKDGIQALWKKLYHLTNVRFIDGVAIGTNGKGDTVAVEEDVVRAVIYNRAFYPFKNVEPDAYCIFPYEGASTEPILYSTIMENYPLLYEYLSSNEELIKNTVECRTGNMWHTFTREHNHVLYDVNKIIIPMTAKDTIATYIPYRGLYMDNANVWFITVQGVSDSIMKAITCVINSTIFSVLAKAGANPQTGGYYKFNKQFLNPVPFPSAKITDGAECVRQLDILYREISELQNHWLSAIPANKDVIARTLETRWNTLDDLCMSLYELTDEEKDEITNIGRTVSRIQLLNGAN